MFRVLVFGLATFAAATLCPADTIYFLTTGQATANTTIDSGHEMEWVAPSLTTSCLMTTCQIFSTTAFDSMFDWSLGGGDFTIKAGNGVSAGITLSIWDGVPGGTLASPTGTLVDTVTLDGSSVSESYTPTAFTFATPVTILAGHHYTATLTSPTGTTGSQQYFIKGTDTLSIVDSSGTGLNGPPPSVPEPSSALLIATGLGLMTAGCFFRRGARSGR